MTSPTIAAIIGYPLGHSMSPPMHNAGFAAFALGVRYEAWPIPIEELPATVERLRGPNVLGISVTVPYKQAVMPLLDEIDPAADAIGAVNTLVKRGRRLIGHNTDKDGFIRSLRESGCDPAGRHVLVLGVGGTERAVAYGLAEAGVASICLAGRNPERVAVAAQQFETTSPRQIAVTRMGFDDASLIGAAAEADLIVNTTPVGMPAHCPGGRITATGNGPASRPLGSGRRLQPARDRPLTRGAPGRRSRHRRPRYAGLPRRGAAGPVDGQRAAR